MKFILNYFDQDTGHWKSEEFDHYLDTLNRTENLIGNKVQGFIQKVSGDRPCDRKLDFKWNWYKLDT